MFPRKKMSLICVSIEEKKELKETGDIQLKNKTRSV